MLHSQLRDMINTSTGTLHTLPRLHQPQPEYHVQPHQYEQSGLYIMVDPETGKPVGGQLVQPEQINAGLPQQQNVLPLQPGSTSHEDSLQHSEQHMFASSSFDSAAHGTGDASVSARHSTCEPSVQETSARSGTSGHAEHAEPIELLTPAFDQSQGAQCGEESQPSRAVSQLPQLSITSLAASSTTAAPAQRLPSHTAHKGHFQGLSDVDEHGLDSTAACEEPSHNDLHSTCPEMLEEAQDGEAGTARQEYEVGTTDQVWGRMHVWAACYGHHFAAPETLFVVQSSIPEELQHIDSRRGVMPCELVQEEMPLPGCGTMHQWDGDTLFCMMNTLLVDTLMSD